MRIALCNEVIADRDFAAQCALAAALGDDGPEIAPYRLRARIDGKRVNGARASTGVTPRIGQ